MYFGHMHTKFQLSSFIRSRDIADLLLYIKTAFFWKKGIFEKNTSKSKSATIFTNKIFPHVLAYISAYIWPIHKKLVTKLKLFKLASDLRKPHLSNSLRSKVIQLWMKCFNFAFSIPHNLQTILLHSFLNNF